MGFAWCESDGSCTGLSRSTNLSERGRQRTTSMGTETVCVMAAAMPPEKKTRLSSAGASAVAAASSAWPAATILYCCPDERSREITSRIGWIGAQESPWKYTVQSYFRFLQCLFERPRRDDARPSLRTYNRYCVQRDRCRARHISTGTGFPISKFHVQKGSQDRLPNLTEVVIRYIARNETRNRSNYGERCAGLTVSVPVLWPATISPTLRAATDAGAKGSTNEKIVETKR
eukprot:6208773-Pleurochrysis_carterae.AAC.2